MAVSRSSVKTYNWVSTHCNRCCGHAHYVRRSRNPSCYSRVRGKRRDALHNGAGEVSTKTAQQAVNGGPKSGSGESKHTTGSSTASGVSGEGRGGGG